MFCSESILASAAAKARRLCLSLAVVAALAAVGAAPAQARADDDWYRVTIVNNSSDVTIHYRWRWDDGEWQECTLAPGESNRHSCQHTDPFRIDAPVPHIRFESGINGNRAVKAYDLKPLVAPVTSSGAIYRFVKVVGKKDYLALLLDDE